MTRRKQQDRGRYRHWRKAKLEKIRAKDDAEDVELARYPCRGTFQYLYTPEEESP